MRIWLTTDTHFGHAKMVELCGRPEDFASRIFDGYKQLRDGDVLLHLGDFCIGKDESWHTQFKFYTGFPSKKLKRWLVRGNHDRKSNSWYIDHGWDWVGEGMELEMFDKRILFTHRPNPITIKPLRREINIHGHLHNTGHHDDVRLTPSYHTLLAIENTNYQPVLLERFLIKTHAPPKIQNRRRAEEGALPSELGMELKKS